MVRDRRRAQTPSRPHPQPGVNGAGLRRSRAGDIRGGYPGPGQRGHCRSDGRSGQIGPAENALSGALRSLFAVAENYPQLRAVESFLQLQETLTATEDKIEYARRYYNTSARDYNIALQTFPRDLIAGPFGFKAVAFFDKMTPTPPCLRLTSRVLAQAWPVRDLRDRLLLVARRGFRLAGLEGVPPAS